MGIKNFKIFRDNFKPSDKRKFDYIIIDGSNLLITFLSVSLNELFDKFGKNFLGGSNVDIIKQSVFLMKHTAKFIINHVNILKYKYQPKDIYIVMDPLETPVYIINNDSDYIKEIFATIVGDESEIPNDPIIKCTLKSLEQEKRRKYNDIDKCRNTLEKKLKVYLENEDEFMKLFGGDKFDETYEQISKIMMSNSQLSFQHQILQLMQLTLDEISEQNIDDNFNLIRAKSEADLAIKCIASTLSGTILIMSKDVDYYILFSDMENAYCSELGCSKLIYNPYNIWKEFLGTYYSYDLVIRISPILGNDYTVHDKLIDCKNYEDIISLFNIDGKLSSLGINKRKTVGKLVSKFPVIYGVITPIELDKLIYENNRKFFNEYYKSVMIYSNWKVYGEYEKIQSNFEKNILKLMQYVGDVYIYSEESFIKEDWESLMISISKLYDEDKLEYFDECREAYMKDEETEDKYEDDYGGEYAE